MTLMEPKKSEQKTKATKKNEYYGAVGRRKEASATVRLYPLAGSDTITVGKNELKQGDIVVNGKPVSDYFSGEASKKLYLEPYRTTNSIDRFATSIIVRGGGPAGQLGAMIHAVSRALLKVNGERFRPILKKRGFLMRDPRTKERRMVGLAGRARGKKQSPKR